MINKYRFFTSTFSFVILGIQPSIGWISFEITHIKIEWREMLSPAQYAILLEWKTERPFSSSLYGEKFNLLNKNRIGEYCCAGCGLALYSSESKYDSSTGWPSFWKPILGNVDCRDDRHFF